MGWVFIMTEAEWKFERDRPIFVISDLHIGDGGARDNFAFDNKLQELNSFLDYVEQRNGQLVIFGDLFEFWQANVGTVIFRYKQLLDRFAKMGAIYVIGNHDADLEAFVGSGMLNHPFFERMTKAFTAEIGGRKFKFMHGHEADPFSSNSRPGWGRILSILGGIIEDKKGSPLLSAGGITERLLLQTSKGFMWMWNMFVNILEKSKNGGKAHHFDSELTPSQSPGRAKGMLLLYNQDKIENGYDAAITGHTHRAKSIGGWYYNSGCWVGIRQNFIEISPDGDVEIFDWSEGKASLNPEAAKQKH